MKHIFLYSLGLIFFFSCTTQQINQSIKIADGYLNGSDDELSNSEVIAGLKEALVKGISVGSGKASAVDGYFKNALIKIVVPPEVKEAEKKLRAVGMGKTVDQFIESMNRAAELAAKESKPIFVNAIKEMTIQDGWGILKGGDNAATEYLRSKTYNSLEGKYLPIIENALNQVNATKYYGELARAYNQIPFVEKIEGDLEVYVTDKALDGLFFLVADEEKKIRKDPAKRTTELLKKVFAKQ